MLCKHFSVKTLVFYGLQRQFVIFLLQTHKMLKWLVHCQGCESLSKLTSTAIYTSNLRQTKPPVRFPLCLDNGPWKVWPEKPLHKHICKPVSNRISLPSSKSKEGLTTGFQRLISATQILWGEGSGFWGGGIYMLTTIVWWTWPIEMQMQAPLVYFQWGTKGLS